MSFKNNNGSKRILPEGIKKMTFDRVQLNVNKKYGTQLLAVFLVEKDFGVHSFIDVPSDIGSIANGTCDYQILKELLNGDLSKPHINNLDLLIRDIKKSSNKRSFFVETVPLNGFNKICAVFREDPRKVEVQ